MTVRRVEVRGFVVVHVTGQVEAVTAGRLSDA